MSEKMERQLIQRLDIPDRLINILEENKITILGELSKRSKTDLIHLGMQQSDTKMVETELELCGLWLKGSL